MSAEPRCVAVTGGCGVVGSWTCRELLRRGHSVVAFDVRANRDHLGSDADRIPIVLGDIRDLPALLSLVQDNGVDTLVHLAATLTRGGEDDPYRAVQTNVLGTLQVLEAVRATRCRRLVFATSRSALGVIDGPHGAPEFRPVAEDFPRWPLNVYGSTKLAAEAICHAYARRYGLDVIGLRFPAMYAPGRTARFGGYALVSRLVEAAAAGEPLELASGGDQLDDLLFVGDAARAVALAVEAGTTHLPVYHISSERLTSPSDVVRVLKDRFPDWRGSVGPGGGSGAAGYTSYALFDDTAAGRDLGYRPAFDLQRGIDAYLDVLREHA